MRNVDARRGVGPAGKKHRGCGGDGLQAEGSNRACRQIDLAGWSMEV
jgi:hypothetical protein